MSRSGYSDDLDYRELALYRGQVASAIRGKRGQKMLRDLIAALEAMPVKELASYTLVQDGECCAIGALALHRGIDVSDLQQASCYEDEYCDEAAEPLARRLDVAHQLVREVIHYNDEMLEDVTPAERHRRVLGWAKRKLIEWESHE